MDTADERCEPFHYLELGYTSNIPLFGLGFDCGSLLIDELPPVQCSNGQ